MNKIKLISLTAAMLLINLIAFAQNATIKGKVTTANGNPASFITIGLKGKGQGTTSDESGNYTIHRVKPGEYTIVASAVGIKPSAQAVTVTA